MGLGQTCPVIDDREASAGTWRSSAKVKVSSEKAFDLLPKFFRPDCRLIVQNIVAGTRLAPMAQS